jgi:hypothetical protein
MNLHSIKMLTAPPLRMYLHYLSYHHVLVLGVHTWKLFQNSAYNIYTHACYSQLDEKYINIPTVIKINFRNIYVQCDR